jgi:CPA1 family monovalent cation:H+ antiporter
MAGGDRVAFVAVSLPRAARVPYTVALVLIGLVVGLIPKLPRAITPELVLYLFLPPLLFAGAWELQIDRLRRLWAPITLLATLGVAIGVTASYALLRFGAGASVEIALLFGAIVAATDPVAVLSVFRNIHVDPDLATLVEGESLFNDGTGVVIFRSILAGIAAGQGLHANAILASFAILAFGGIALGLLVGYVVSRITSALAKRLGWYVFVTVVLAYGLYILAEDIHVSGIMAVLTAGVVVSALARAKPALAEAVEETDRFWEVLGLLANTALFLLVGLSVNLAAIVAAWPAAGWAILAIVVGRAATVYGIAPLSALFGVRLNLQRQNALAVGGLRGALSMALALSLPSGLPERELLITMVFSAVVFTLVVQGLAVQFVVKPAV